LKYHFWTTKSFCVFRGLDANQFQTLPDHLLCNMPRLNDLELAGNPGNLNKNALLASAKQQFTNAALI
jgi:hypothetical protein